MHWFKQHWKLVTIGLVTFIIITIGWKLMRTQYYSQDFTTQFNQPLKTYYLGRFAIDVPQDLGWSSRSFMVHHSNIVEATYENHEVAKQELLTHWAQRQKTLSQQPPPKDKSQTLIRTLNFSSMLKRPAHGFYYHGHKRYTDRVYLDVITVADNIHAVFTGWSKYPDRLTQGLIDTVNSYFPSHPEPPFNPDSFFTEYGRVEAPWSGYEEVITYFDGGTLDVEIEISMHSISRPPEANYLIQSYKESLQEGWPIHFTMYRLRPRTIAGMAGEESVIKLAEPIAKRIINTDPKQEPEIWFTWQFTGEQKSGERPWIQIEMVTSTGNLKEKFALWDTLLNSFQPIALVATESSYDVSTLIRT